MFSCCGSTGTFQSSTDRRIYCVKSLITATLSFEVFVTWSLRCRASCFTLSNIDFHSILWFFTRPRRSFPEEGVLSRVATVVAAPPIINPNKNDLPLDIINPPFMSSIVYHFHYMLSSNTLLKIGMYSLKLLCLMCQRNMSSIF